MRCAMYIFTNLMLGTVVSSLKASDSPPQELSKTCGVCIAGLARTFPVPSLHQRQLKNIISPLKQDGWNTSVFLYLASEDDPRSGGQGVSLHGLDRAVAAFEPAGSTIIARDSPVPHNSQCRQDCFDTQKFTRWYGQWGKVQGCYDLLTKAEHDNGRVFDYLLKLRSDLFITSPITPSKLFVPHTLVVPRGLVDHGSDAVNDWFAGCDRQKCEPYFRMTKTWTSCSGGSFKQSLHLSDCHNSERVLNSNLKAHGIHVREESLIMTIMPTCDGPACRRIAQMCPYHDTSLCSQLAAECVRESENVNCTVDPARYERFVEQAEARASLQEVNDFVRKLGEIRADDEDALHEFLSSE